MSVTESRLAFRQRLRRVRRQMGALRVASGFARIALAAMFLAASIAAVDYIFELSFAARGAMFAGGLVAVLLLGVRWVVRPIQNFSQHRLVVLLEGLFPGLGQCLRTVLEHGDKPADQLLRAGVEPEMVAALEDDTRKKIGPLPLRSALPVRPALFAVGSMAICLAALGISSAHFSEWRTALGRALLSSDPYTTVAALPSAGEVDEGADVEIRATVSGRARPSVILYVREVGEPDWRQEPLEPVDGKYTFWLPHLCSNTEFFVSAGPDATAAQRIVVRHPLKVVAAHVEVKAPAYTGVSPTVHSAGSFSAVESSTALIRFELDRAPAVAALMVKDRNNPGTPAKRVELTIQDRRISGVLPLTGDLEYTIEARDAEGISIAPNRYLARVTADQPPRVWFDQPAETTEVHTLAEVLFRARASDDFGITRIGIVYQVNNEDSRTLIVQDVARPCQRTVFAEQILMLEQFMLTEKDCVGYYAFAEDNRPGAPQRVTTDLRFIDIRPFRRIYQLIEGSGGGGGAQRDLIFLDEVIGRQRFNLNRTMRLEARSKVRLDLAQVEEAAVFESQLAAQTHRLADFLIEEKVDGAALLTQAEETMLSAVDSIQGANFTIAIGQERDALRYLMEARNTVRQALLKSSPQVRARARAFDRLLRQNLRQGKDEADALTAIAAELQRLASAEDDVAQFLTVAMNDIKDGQERQDDIAAGTTAVDRAAAAVKDLTALARTRISAAAEAANSAADAFGQKDRATARKEVDRARELLHLAAQHVAALAAREPTQQIASARVIANELAAQTSPQAKPATGGQEAMPNIGNAADKARTLKDILERVGALTDQSDAEAARLAAAALKSEDLGAAIKRLEQPGIGADRNERQDLSERFSALGQRLERAYRELVAPYLEALARLEQEATELQRRLNSAENDAERRGVRRQAAEFIERLDAAGLGDVAAEEFRQNSKGGPEAATNEQFARELAVVRDKLIAKLKHVVAGDQFKATAEAVPPEYGELVERYLRTLSRGNSK